jgi:hypothetical protein
LKVSTFQASEDFLDEKRFVLLSEESNVFKIPSFRTSTDILDEAQCVMSQRVNGLKDLQHFFVSYLETLSVSRLYTDYTRTVYSVGCCMNDELERIWKEAAVA